MLALIKPENAEKLTVKNSGTDVAIPAIFPTVFGDNSIACASFRKIFTKKYIADFRTHPINRCSLKSAKILSNLILLFQCIIDSICPFPLIKIHDFLFQLFHLVQEPLLHESS